MEVPVVATIITVDSYALACSAGTTCDIDQPSNCRDDGVTIVAHRARIDVLARMSVRIRTIDHRIALTGTDTRVPCPFVLGVASPTTGYGAAPEFTFWVHEESTARALAMLRSSRANMPRRLRYRRTWSSSLEPPQILSLAAHQQRRNSTQHWALCVCLCQYCICSIAIRTCSCCPTQTGGRPPR